MSAPLPSPVRDALVESVDEVAVQRMWRGVRARRAMRRGLRDHARAAGVGFAAAAAIVLALYVRASVSARHATPTVAATLHRTDGGELTLLAPPSAMRAPWTVAFDDGSAITLAAGARLETLENTATQYTTMLASGRVHFEVHPGGPRRWSIECGVATVDVIGTGFTIEREGEHLSVAVTHGVVLVRGERVPERVQRLVAGQSIDVAPSEVAIAPSVTTSPSVAAPPPPPAPVAPVAALHARTPWRDLAHARAFGAAYDTLGASGIASTAQTASVEDLLALADVARLSGHPADAIAPLARIVEQHAGDSNAGVAAFTMGRIELDQLHDAARAADAFERAIALGVPNGLLEDAYARRVEARARRGDREGARTAAEQYRSLFPRGRRAAQVAAWAAAE